MGDMEDSVMIRIFVSAWIRGLICKCRGHRWDWPVREVCTRCGTRRCVIVPGGLHKLFTSKHADMFRAQYENDPDA